MASVTSAAGATTLAIPSVPVHTVAAPANTAGASMNGRVEAVQQATLSAQVAGNVLLMAVKAGDRVRAGQVLARIDERSAEAGVAASQAGVAQADAVVQAAKLHADRTQSLLQQGFVSAAALDEAQARLRAAQAGLAQARAGQTQATLQQGFATLRAPFDGIVLATHAEQGDLATPGRPLLTVYQPGRLRAVVDVPASRNPIARAARQWEVVSPDGRRWAPVSRTELPNADPVAQTTEWRLALPADAAGLLSPGLQVDVRFVAAANPPAPSNGPTRPRVPVQALLQRGELSAVYAVQNGRFVLRPVRTAGPLNGPEVEIAAGLRPGEQIARNAIQAGLAGAQPAR